MANYSLINISLSQLPRSPQLKRIEDQTHPVFTDEKYVEEILKWCPSMKDIGLVNRTFSKVASKIRQNRSRLIIQDSKTVMDSEIHWKLFDKKINHVHIGKFTEFKEDEVFRSEINENYEDVDDSLCNTSFPNVIEIVEKQKFNLITLELRKIQISFTNFLKLWSELKTLENLILIQDQILDIIINNAAYDEIKSIVSKSKLKKLFIYECDSTQSITKHLFVIPHGYKSCLEELYIRMKSVDAVYLNSFISNCSKLKKLNLQLVNQLKPLELYAFKEISLTHFTIYVPNSDYIDSIIETQTSLEYFDSKMGLSPAVVQALSKIKTLKTISFYDYKIRMDDIKEIAQWKNLNTVLIDFSMVYYLNESFKDVLSIFFKNQFKYSLHFAENSSSRFYKLSKRKP